MEGGSGWGERSYILEDVVLVSELPSLLVKQRKINKNPFILWTSIEGGGEMKEMDAVMGGELLSLEQFVPIKP